MQESVGENGLNSTQSIRLSLMRVLIVDDSAFDRELLEATLRKLSFQNIQHAEDGAIATRKIQNATDMRASFDLIFMDAQMPGRDGQALLKWIRKSKEGARQLVIVTSGTSDMEGASRLIEIGVNGFVVKPVTMDILRQKILKALHLEAARAG